MKIYFAGPGIDTGLVDFLEREYLHLLFSFYDLTDSPFQFRKDMFKKIIKEYNESL